MAKKRISRVMNFKSRAAYLRWLRALYGIKRLRKKYATKPPHVKVLIRGKPVKVKHKKK